MLDEESLTRERVRQLKKQAADLGLQENEIKTLFNLIPTNNDYKSFSQKLKTKLLLRKFLIYLKSWKDYFLSRKLVIAFLVLIFGCVLSPSFRRYSLETVRDLIEHPCLISIPEITTEFIRPHVPCEICRDLERVPVVYNISQKEFTDSYAYTGIPVLIKGATWDWKALQNFNYQYFKRLYTTTKGSLKHVDNRCQFFRYQTEFESLDEVFQMSDERANFKNGTRPWYIGWSNCDSNRNKAGKKLRTQYTRPYFLPKYSSNMDTDWMFMGGPGFGAGMHIDFVQRPSWQAQVSGSKTWLLDPSPECWNECHRLEVTVEKGDIIVFDANIWYHSTRVNPGNISITIGAEYD